MQSLDYLVISKTDDGEFDQLGTFKFVLTPRVGEHITVEFANGAHAFKVIAVLHPEKPASTAAELIVKYVDTDVKFRLSL